MSKQIKIALTILVIVVVAMTILDKNKSDGVVNSMIKNEISNSEFFEDAYIGANTESSDKKEIEALTRISNENEY